MPKSNTTVLNRQAYTLAVRDGKHAELTLYGDIVETRPIDWWTDEPVPGNFITQDEFLTDLETIKGSDDLTIHLNSCGGDAYVSFAIHNRLRELADAGMKITCIVDGAAMSGGSIIMCAADTVKVNPSSLILIHDCWSYAYGRINSTGLRKLADDLDVINESQAEIYVRKTGMEASEIRAMMQKETLMTGRKAAELGFADELLDHDVDPDIEVSADHKSLYVKGRRMRVAAMAELPEGIKTHAEEIKPVPETDGGDNKTPEASGSKEGGIPMTFEDFRKENPEAAEAAISEAQAQARQEAETRERARMSEIDAVANLFGEDVVRAAKYDNPCTAQEMTYRAALENAKQGKKHMENLQSDVAESNASAVPAASAPTMETPKEMSNDEKIAAGRELARSLKGEKKEEV